MTPIRPETNYKDEASGAGIIEALPAYYPSLDGIRAFSVFFVIFEHVTLNQSALRHFHGWLGVDIFFVLSGFLITSLLFREERLTGSVDMVGFYVRRAFRILPLYWVILAVYVVMLQPAKQAYKWQQMKHALPYFLTFNNDIPLILMPEKVGTIFGLSWTLGIEEKFYFFWPLICFVLLRAFGKRLFAGWMVYVFTLLMAIFSFKMSRAYSGLVVGAILAMLFSSNAIVYVKKIAQSLPPVTVVLLLVGGFILVDINERFVYVFSWIITIVISSLLFNRSWLTLFLERPLFVWLGKRSYAMYLVQGFGIEFVELLLKPKNVFYEIAIALSAFFLTSLGASILHRIVEEPARKLGKKIVALRNQKKLMDVRLAVTE
jgi:peptidoglycan/LPS O-acetylase OafA/YrhL